MVKSKFAQISSLGRFRNKYGKVYYPKPSPGMYCSVEISGNQYKLHRIVAAAFLPPRERADQTQVDHIDNKKENNCADNLRWVSACENINNQLTKKNRKSGGPKKSKPVKAKFVGESEWSRRFESSYDAATKLGLSQQSVSNCCNKKQKSSGGYEFDFDEPNEPPVLPGEEWRVYGNGVSVSSFGRRRNDKTGVVSWGCEREGGYMTTSVGGKPVQIHRMVAETFLPPPEPGQDEVDHKDGNPSNNHFKNLRWVTRKENVQASYNNNLNRGTPAEQLSLSVEVLRGDEVKVYPSVTKAAEALGVLQSHITACLSGRVNTARGYRFRKVPAADMLGEEWKDISDDILEVAKY